MAVATRWAMHMGGAAEAAEISAAPAGVPRAARPRALSVFRRGLMMLSGLPTCGGGLGQGLWSPELWPALAPDGSACVTPEPIPRRSPL